MKNGKVIVLNGTSSSGKTTTARAIQSISAEQYLLCQLDAFWHMTPRHVPASSKNFPNMKLALAKSVRGLVETGHNVIVDIIFCADKTYAEISSELKGIDLTIVKIDCPLAELAKREEQRGDRKIGLAQSQYKAVHIGADYDLVINTANHTPEQCAEMILAHKSKVD